MSKIMKNIFFSGDECITLSKQGCQTMTICLKWYTLKLTLISLWFRKRTYKIKLKWKTVSYEIITNLHQSSGHL